MHQWSAGSQGSAWRGSRSVERGGGGVGSSASFKNRDIWQRIPLHFLSPGKESLISWIIHNSSDSQNSQENTKLAENMDASSLFFFFPLLFCVYVLACVFVPLFARVFVSYCFFSAAQ